MSDKNFSTASELLTPLSTCSENDIYDPLLETRPHCEPTSGLSSNVGLNETHISTDLKKISCFLAGEIEVPDDVPCWKILCPPQSYEPSPTTSCRKRKLPDRQDEVSESKRKRSLQKECLDIRIPDSWDLCLLTLWEHAISNSFLTQNVRRDVFVERICRIGALASHSLKHNGFFTIKHLLGLTRATKLFQWANDNWRNQRHLFRAGRLSSDDNVWPVQRNLVRTDSVAWFNTNEIGPTKKAITSFPEVRLLLLYLDAIVRSMGVSITNRNGYQARITSRSWSALCVYQKQPNDVGYVSHYDNPSTLSDGRVLTALYYLNPVWKRHWGGQLIIWPNKTYADKPVHVEPGADTASPSNTHPLAILPTLDRLVLFYADERTPHRVQPLYPASEVDRRFAVSTWYFDHDERSRFLASHHPSLAVS